MTALSGAHPAADKLACFEAIRGLASLAVVIAHTLLSFFPAMYACFGPGWDRLSAEWQWLARLGRCLWDGPTAVAVFFVLSGFVLSLNFFRDGSSPALASAASRRYLRLMLPVAASVLLAYTLLAAGAMSNQVVVQLENEAQEAPPGEPAWLGCHYNFAPSFQRALREAVYGAFFRLARYNEVLWTMPVELRGSFLVFGFLALFGRLRNRWVFYGVLGGMLFYQHEYRLLNFLLGMGLCDLWVHNSRTWRLSLPLAPALALIAVALFMVPWKPLIALLIVGTVAAAPRLQQWLASRWLGWLGRVSFGLYLVHMPVVCSLGCGLYVFLCRDLGWSHNAGGVLAALVGLTASLLAGWIFYHVVDRPTIVLTRWIDSTLFRPRGESGAVAGQTSARRQVEESRPLAA